MPNVLPGRPAASRLRAAAKGNPMKRLILFAALISLNGCAYVRGSWLNINCDFGTDVEIPCYCHRSSYQVFGNGCPPPETKEPTP